MGATPTHAGGASCRGVRRRVAPDQCVTRRCTYTQVMPIAAVLEVPADEAGWSIPIAVSPMCGNSSIPNEAEIRKLAPDRQLAS